ncbi:MAG: hypothetical protein KA419_00130 [Acidobacteria bacterium]|nr:hypothetical protein [Acidobacteriota bacterium]
MLFLRHHRSGPGIFSFRIWLAVLFAAVFFPGLARPSDPAIPGPGSGLLFGENYLFRITAPDGWVLDNQSGRTMGLDAVFYPKGESWEKTEIRMYVQVWQKEGKGLKEIVEEDIRNYRKTFPALKVGDEEPIRLTSGKAALVKQFVGGNDGAVESVAWFDEKRVVVALVLSAKSVPFFDAARPDFVKLVLSYDYLGEAAVDTQGPDAKEDPATGKTERGQDAPADAKVEKKNKPRRKIISHEDLVELLEVRQWEVPMPKDTRYHWSFNVIPFRKYQVVEQGRDEWMDRTRRARITFMPAEGSHSVYRFWLKQDNGTSSGMVRLDVCNDNMNLRLECDSGQYGLEWFDEPKRIDDGKRYVLGEITEDSGPCRHKLIVLSFDLFRLEDMQEASQPAPPARGAR